VLGLTCPQKFNQGISRGRWSVERRPPILGLALLWQIFWDARSEEFIAVGASAGWWSDEEVKNGLPDGRHGRLRPHDSFFRPAALMRRYWRNAKAIMAIRQCRCSPVHDLPSK